MKLELFENKGKFYDRLWQDLLEYKRPKDGRTYSKKDVADSFIFQYYKAKKLKTATRLINDPEEFKKYLEKFNINSDNKFVLLYAARRLFEQEKINIETYRKAFNKASKNVYKSKDVEAAPDSKHAFVEVLYKLQLKYVYKIFSDAGYRQKDFNENGDMSQRIIAESDDKLEDIEMMYEYFRYLRNGGVYINRADPLFTEEYKAQRDELGGVYTDRPAELTEEYKALCEALFAVITEDEDFRADVFFPLYVDPSSGAGVYIIGDYRAGMLNSDGCSVYTAQFASIAPVANMFENNQAYDVHWGFNMTRFDSVAEAFKDFESDTLTLANKRYKGYIDYNEDFPIELLEKDGLEPFLKFRATSSQLDLRTKLTAQEQARIAKTLHDEEVRKAKEAAAARAEEKRRSSNKDT